MSFEIQDILERQPVMLRTSQEKSRKKAEDILNFLFAERDGLDRRESLLVAFYPNQPSDPEDYVAWRQFTAFLQHTVYDESLKEYSSTVLFEDNRLGLRLTEEIIPTNPENCEAFVSYLAERPAVMNPQTFDQA